MASAAPIRYIGAMRAATVVALSCLPLLFACDDAATSGTDTQSTTDTVPLLDSSDGAIFDPDTHADTSLPEDTSLPNDTTPADTTPADTTPADTTPADTTPADTTPADTTPADTTPADTTPADTTPADTTPADTTPADTTPADTTPADTTPADTTPADTTPADTSDTTDTDTGPVEPVDNGLNASWVGGACDGTGDCDHPSFNEAARCETAGFPNGFCTQACRQSATSGAWICPDADTAAGTAFTTTRCISADGEPRCATECDFTKADGGCRPGYACVLRSRHGQPDKVFPVCLPADIGRWPGEPELPDDVGAACSVPSDCAHRSCLALPGGYCSKAYCDATGCPGASTCFGFSGGESACLADCGVDGDCRTGDGYACDDDGTCWPSDEAPSWNAAVGAGDCASAWGNAGSGLSGCDATKDDYVVLHKSARNLALCNRGSLIANYRMGLGFAPIGDKQVEGDGKTPEGVFYVAQLVPDSDYYQAFVVSYPDKTDATRGLGGGIITQAQKNAIDTAQTQCSLPPQSTGLGGWIEIHGEGGESDWTFGCAALDNDAIDVLWSTLGVRDTIVILP